jgi:FkbM family methyltransferase
MSFPEHDSYWKNVAAFLKKQIQPSDRLLAPLEFRDYFDDQVVDYGAAWSDRLTWVVLHKGMLGAVGLAQLNAIDAYCVPVFANEVFVVFSQARRLKRLSLDSPHLQAYRVQKERAYRSQLEAIAPSAPADQATRERESIYLGHHRALTRTVWGHKMFVDTEDVSLSPHLLLDGYWELWVTRLFQDWVQPGMRVVDVGSNIGYFTLIAASQVGQAGHVYAFEPNPSTFELLQRNVEINGLGDRTTLIQKAVFSESKTVRFHHLKQHHAYSSLNLYPDESLKKLQDESIAFDVDAISLDEYFAEFNAAIDVVKIDIEGGEPDVLRGMQMLIRQNPKLAIICEFESYRFQQAGTDPGAFLRELHDWGLVMRLINDQSQLVDVSVETLLNLKSYCYLLLTQ